MVSNFLWLMNFVRTEILEGFNLPELDISYWDFCIILAAVGIVATVLINSVRISGGSVASERKVKARKERARKERARKERNKNN